MKLSLSGGCKLDIYEEYRDNEVLAGMDIPQEDNTDFILNFEFFNLKNSLATDMNYKPPKSISYYLCAEI